MHETPSPMNVKRLLLAIVAGFVFIFATDFLVHGVWLVPDYTASMPLWRPEGEMQAHMPFLALGQFLCATTFVFLWAKGFADRGGSKCALIYGAMMGLFSQVNTLVTYAVMTLPGVLAVKWFVVGVLQAIGLGIVTFLVYKPAAPVAR